MPERPLIKICGITRPEDAVLAAELGATFIGLNFYPESKRVVTVKQAMEIVRSLEGTDVKKVAVFVDADKDDILRMRDQVGFEMIQLHGEETPDFCSSIHGPVIKSFPVGTIIDEKLFSEYYGSAEYFLFDTADRILKGGTGRSFDWAILRKWKKSNPDRKFFIAGGLSPANIKTASMIRPFGLDVNSGVESAPGVKDPVLMRKLFEKLK